jgi:Mn2+/Fe2+ NRAMP family transporter
LLTACLEEDRRSIDAQWTEVEDALNQAILENERRSQRRRIFYLLFALAIVCLIVLPAALRVSGLVFVVGVFQSILLVLALGLRLLFSHDRVAYGRFHSEHLGDHGQPHVED